MRCRNGVQRGSVIILLSAAIATADLDFSSAANDKVIVQRGHDYEVEFSSHHGHSGEVVVILQRGHSVEVNQSYNLAIVGRP